MKPIANFIAQRYPIPWSMTIQEQAVLIQLLRTLKPKVAIEVGTYNGGSLQVLSKFSKKVYAIDVNPHFRDNRCNNFKNVIYLNENSQQSIPELVKNINQHKEIVEFVLIDANHSTEGVYKDISNILNLVPKQNITIVIHDSFNPNCRRGIKRYNYNNNQFVHYVELDFVSGVFNIDNLYREMWGGFAIIEMRPEKRQEPLKIYAKQRKLFKLVYFFSLHFFKILKPIYKLFNNLKSKFT